MLLILLCIDHFHDSGVSEDALAEAGEALVHINAFSGTRLHERDVMFGGESLPIQLRNLATIDEICFIADEHYLDSAA